MAKKMTLEEALSYLQENNRKIDIVEWCGSKSKSIFRCVVCGHEWSTSFSNIKHLNNGCPRCAKKRSAIKLSINYKEAQSYLKDNNRNISIIEWGGGSSKKSTFKCDVCGHEWSTSFDSIKNRGSGCLQCVGRVQITKEDAEKYLKENNRKISIVKYGGKCRAKSLFKCDMCGYVWTTTFDSIKRGSGCSSCASSRYIYDNDVFDSSWELIFYLYWRLRYPLLEIKRVKTYGAVYITYYDEHHNMTRRWFPDFIIDDSLFVEIKPIDDSFRGELSNLTRYKKKASEEVWWVGDVEIEKYRQYLEKEGIEIGRYRCNDSVEEAQQWLDKHKRNINITSWSGRGRNKSVFECGICNHKWTTTFGSIKRGSGCPRCSGNITITKEEAEKYLKDNNKNISIIEWGGNGSKKSTFKCDVCGHGWSTSFGNIKQGNGCPICSKQRTANKLSTTKEEAETYLKDNKRNISIIEWGGRCGTKSLFKCDVCGYEWTTTFNSIYSGHGCRNCVGTAPVTEKEAKAYLIKHKREIFIVRWGGCGHKKSIFRCSICGHEWTTTFDSIKRGTGCAKCSVKHIAEKQTTTLEEAQSYLKDNNRNISIVKWGGGSRPKSLFKCDVCGHEWSTSFSSIRNRGTGCKKCSFKAMGIKQAITLEEAQSYLKDNNRNISIVKWGNGCGTKSLFKCDICEHEWGTTFNEIKHGTGCPKCAHHIKITEEEASKYLIDNNRNIAIVKWGGKCAAKSTFKCDVCDYEWTTTFDSVKRGTGCKKCSRRRCANKRSTKVEEAQNYLKENNKNTSIIKRGGCCPVCTTHKYIYGDDIFDSSWELIFYLYWKSLNPLSEIERPYVLGNRYITYFDTDTNKERKWYPDFLINNNQFVEIKSDDDSFRGEKSNLTRHKRIVSKEVLWIGDKAIAQYKQYLNEKNIDIEQYRQC